MIKTGYLSIPEKLHLVITGETGKALSYVVQRDRLAVLLGVLLLLFVFLAVGPWVGAIFFQEKNALAAKAAVQAEELDALHAGLTVRLKQQLAAQEHFWQKKIASYEAVISSLTEEKNTVIRQLQEEKEALVCRYEEEISSLNMSSSSKIADLLAELDQERLEKQELLNKTAGRLDERSRIIESLMSRIGVDVKVGKKTANSGGPFLAADVDENYYEDLLSRSDQYIKKIRTMPLGTPVQNARITSGFGRRSDPFNHRPAFHAGLDLKSRTGAKIMATADGVVKKSGYDPGGFGHYVIVRHSSSYETLYGHLSKRLTKKGDKIRRGDVLGLLGNSGRSTGPHLHYEVHYKGKPINPKKYLSVADLSFTVPM